MDTVAEGHPDSEIGYDALEDPEQLKTLTIEMLLGIYDGRLGGLRENEVKIDLSMGMANGVEEWKAQAEKRAMLRKVFRLDRDRAVLDIYRREILRRGEISVSAISERSLS